MRVKCSVEEIDIEGDYSDEVPGLCVTCARCGHTAEVFGQSEASRKRGLVMLREECPEGENNFYVDEEES